MAGPYGDSAKITAMLTTSGTTYDANHNARLDALNVTISLLMDEALGRTFGATAADQTVLFWAKDSDVLVLPRPIRTITSVTVGGTVAGSTMTGGTVYNTSLWTPSITDPSGQIYAIRLLSGGWWGDGMPVQIVGQWAAVDNDAEPPDDLIYAVNYLVVESFKRENTSVVTDDGVVVPRRDPWDDPIVKRVIDKYSVSNKELVL